ncbi:MAG TPA: GWxTD domain-containing protein, partial [Bacteroidota bacterium]|nr:GWxTD domain-containing protein [Bacteroidota bacterium]
RREEFDSLRSAAVAEREQLLNQFWNVHGGAQRRSDFETRIDEADKLFTDYMEGSRTPMGITYIVCGPPDAVECRSPLTETWYYEVGNQTMALPFHTERKNGEMTYYELPAFSINEQLWRTYIDQWRRR